VMRPRTSLGKTPALRQSIGMTALLIYVLGSPDRRGTDSL
jgi:hypothetical protein